MFSSSLNVGVMTSALCTRRWVENKLNEKDLIFGA